MLVQRLVLLACVLLVVPAFAGCADETPSATSEPIKKGNASPAPTESGSTPVPQPKPKGTSQRWHFHDYWQGHPTITLFNATVKMEPGVTEDGIPVYGHLVELDRNVIVPPETGFLTITLNWTTPEPGPVNVTYRPADASTFVPFLDLPKASPTILPVTESMADVPHRQESNWRFNLTVPTLVDPNAPGAPKGLPPAEMLVTIEATIGRPLFIDPPHLDWWAGGDVIPLVVEAKGDLVSVATPVKNVTVLGVPPTQPSPRSVKDNVTVPVDEGRIVPEGVKSIVVLLNWTSPAPNAKLGVRYEEANLPSGGPLTLAQDGTGSRVFVLPVNNSMSDTTYSNRTTWRFYVTPEGEAAAAFQGSFTLFAWATRLDAADAVRATLGV